MYRKSSKMQVPWTRVCSSVGKSSILGLKATYGLVSLLNNPFWDGWGGQVLSFAKSQKDHTGLINNLPESTQAWIPVLSWILAQELRQLKLLKSYSREIYFAETSETWQGEMLDPCGLTCSKAMMVPQKHNQDYILIYCLCQSHSDDLWGS